MFTRRSKKLSAITNVCYKSVRYLEVFLWELDRDSADSSKKVSTITRCPLYSMSAIDRFDCIIFWKSGGENQEIKLFSDNNS